MTKSIDTFRGKYFFLSNFYNHPVEFQGLVYQNNEAAFQAAKVTSPEIRKQFVDLPPNEAKYLGRHVQLRPDWEQIKVKVMAEIVLNKFSNPVLQAKLLNTGDATLIEGNQWHDTTWGMCNGRGKNYLGKILMAVRDHYRQ